MVGCCTDNSRDLCPGSSGADPDPAAILVGPMDPFLWNPQDHPGGNPRATSMAPLGPPRRGCWASAHGDEAGGTGWAQKHKRGVVLGQDMLLSHSEVTAEVPPGACCASGCPTAERTNSLHLSLCSWESEGR